MPKNIVLCLDGTGNEYGSHNTNVLLLNEVLERSEEQVVFYDPGVGTFSVRDTLTGAAQFWQKVMGLAFGFGLRQNVADSYAFVMQHYEVGDRIYIFGFSRGAYTARLVAALIHGIGILPVGAENLVAYALRYLQMEKGALNFRRLHGFAKQFGLHPAPKNIFLGVWDTVASVSWAFDRQVYAYTTKNKSVSQARHAVAIDERREFFPVSLLNERTPGQVLKQVLFPGVHSDVGGGYTEEKGEADKTGALLSMAALEWMLVESRDQGLKIDEQAAFELFEQRPSDPLAPRHESLAGPWWACEFWPRRTWNWSKWAWSYRANFGRRRSYLEQLPVHEAVDLRMKSTTYKPPGISIDSGVEQRVPFSMDGGRRILPPWPAPSSPPTPEARTPISPASPLLAVVSTYMLVAVLAAPILFGLLFLSSGGLAVLARPLLWPGELLHLIEFLWSHPNRFALSIFPIAFLLGAILLERIAPLDIARRQSKEKLPHLCLWNDRETLRMFLKRLKVDGRLQYARALKFDFGFMALYLSAFLWEWSFCSSGTGPVYSSLALMVLGVGADLVENRTWLSELSRPTDDRSSPRTLLAARATTVKMVSIALAVLLLTIELAWPGNLSWLP